MNNGKGDNRRKSLVDYSTYRQNWERIFGRIKKSIVNKDGIELPPMSVLMESQRKGNDEI